MRIKKNGKVVRLTESDLQRIVKKVLNESNEFYDDCSECVKDILPREFISLSTEIESYLKKDTGKRESFNDIIKLLAEVDPKYDKRIPANLYNNCQSCSAGDREEDDTNPFGV
jgi:hypothetical protein